jgi:hypothetical protein
MSDATEVEPFVGHGPGGTLTESEARALLAELKTSGMTMKAFAKARGMHPQRLSWWRGRFAKRSPSATRRPPGRPSKSPATAPRFLPVAVSAQSPPAAPRGPVAAAGSAYELALGADRTLRIPHDFHEDSLARLLRVLRETR